MERFTQNVDEIKTEIIRELCSIQKPTPIHITHCLDLFYELNCLIEQVSSEFQIRDGIDLSERGCILKTRIYHYASFAENTFLSRVHYLDTQLTYFQRFLIPTNIQLNFSRHNPIGTLNYSLSPYGLDATPAWFFDIDKKGSNVNTRPTLPCCIDSVNHKLYFYCETTTRGFHVFDLRKHSLTNIIPFAYEPYGVCVDSDYLYALAIEGRPYSNGIMKLEIKSNLIVKKWLERSKPEFLGFETDANDLYTLRGNSLCVFSKNALSQLRELKFARKPSFTGKVKDFSLYSGNVYILPQDVRFDVLVYSLTNGDLVRTVSLQVDQVCSEICIGLEGNIVCNNFKKKANFDVFSSKGELLHSFTLPDKNANLVALHYMKPHIIVLCVLPGDSIRILAY